MLTILQFQIEDNQRELRSGTMLKMYCPGKYNHFPHKLMIKNGKISNNVKYQDLCVERFAVNVAYNNDPWVFEVENNSMVDLRVKYGYLHGELEGVYSTIAENDEILSKFFLNHNIIVNWINCYFTWGWFDYEKGKWTGAVGKVNTYSVLSCIKINH